MRHVMAVITILLIFLLTPVAADYFAAPGTSWAIGICLLVYETWVLAFKKTSKDLAEEKARLEEARRRVEQIKHEAAMVYLQPAGGKGGKKSTGALDVDRMSPAELANAARKIVQDIHQKKSGKKGDEADAPLSNAA